MGSSARDIEAELKATREDLADTVNALEYKLDVPARAQERASALGAKARRTVGSKWKPFVGSVGALVVAGSAVFIAKRGIEQRREDRRLAGAKRSIRQARKLIDRVDADSLRERAQRTGVVGRKLGRRAQAAGEVAGKRVRKSDLVGVLRDLAGDLLDR